MNYVTNKRSNYDLTDAREAEKAKKEDKIPFLCYLKKRWLTNMFLKKK